MEGSKKEHRLIRFSMFELDLDSGELFKDGRTIKLQGQPFELLTLSSSRLTGMGTFHARSTNDRNQPYHEAVVVAVAGIFRRQSGIR